MIYVSIGRHLYESIESAHEALRQGVLSDFGGCETRLIDTNRIIEEIQQINTQRKLIVYLLKYPFVMSETSMAKAFQQQALIVLKGY